VDEATRKAIEVMQIKAETEAEADQPAPDGGVAEQAEAGETPMQRMQREALEEQAAADLAHSSAASPMLARQPPGSEEPLASAAVRRPSGAMRKVLNRYLFDINTVGGKVINYGVLVLVVGAVAMSMLKSLPNIHASWGGQIDSAQIAILYIFTVEYLLRVYAAKDRRKYILGFYGIIDLLTVLPILFGGPGTAIMRLFRLFRIVKIAQYFPVLTTLLRSVSGAKNMIFAVFITIAAVSVFAGNIAYMLEPETFHNAFVGTWWSLVTMSTVGYGDLVPHTMAGMALGGILILVGICVVAMMTAVIAVRVGRMVNMTNSCLNCDKPLSSEYSFCPHCGQDQADEIDLFTDDE